MIVEIDSAELAQLRKDSAEWRAQKDVIVAATIEDTLHLSLRVNHRGRYITRDGVIANYECLQSHLGLQVVAMRAEQYAREMYASINKAADAEGAPE